MIKHLPIVLIFSATDGTGGAGTISDYRAASTSNCLPLAVITAITAQNLEGVDAYWPVPSQKINAQLQCFAQTLPNAIKVGVIGKAATTISHYQQAQNHTIPLVWDPVLSPTQGGGFIAQTHWRYLQKHYLPHVLVATPNRQELLLFSNEKRIDNAVQKWHSWGVRNIIVTDIDGKGKTIRNALFSSSSTTPSWETTCTRLPYSIHGTGCYYSTKLAASLAHNKTIIQAMNTAQKQTDKAIFNAVSIPTLGKQRLIS